ncbi:hypothetical protein B4110_1525 [Parageobacillus toebii]|uniref:Uncharacterized protein n=1 Tax=Parageobacillus toebii TaxID=153151 RepID=A0A150MKE5_9BACL|nr:hypothetical protein B4110_1525 [Parageobacillus toebii]
MGRGKRLKPFDFEYLSIVYWNEQNDHTNTFSPYLTAKVNV